MNPIERACVIGTFPTWKETPWSDPGLRMVTLNDAYTLGLKRIDEMYDIHPLDRLYFRKRDQREVRADLVPPGYFVRPEGHIDWLKEQARTIPVWLKDQPSADWPVNARRFPLEYLEQKYGAYWASGPSYILMHLIDRGVKDLWIFGIHLATEREYIDQRPNFENILGRFLGLEWTVILKDGKRYYEGANTRVVLPESCPILTHKWKYGYEPSPQPDPRLQQMKLLQQQQQMVLGKLATAGRWANRAPMQDRLKRINARLMDLQQGMEKASMGSTIQIPVVA